MTTKTRQLVAAALVAAFAVLAGTALFIQQPSTSIAVADTTLQTTSSVTAPSTTAASSTTTSAPAETTTTTANPFASMTPEEQAAFAAFVAGPTTTVATPPATGAVATPATLPPNPGATVPQLQVDPSIPDAAYTAVGLAPPTTTPPPAPEPEPAPEPAPEPEPAAEPTGSPLDGLSPGDQAFLACVRWRESRGNYGAVNPSSGAGGAYQFLQTTWNNTAAHAGRYDLVGVRPNWASAWDQDFIAVHLLQWYGRSPWGYSC